MNRENLKINRNEVLRYLGYKNQNIDKKIDSLIDECIEETKRLITPRQIYIYKDIKLLDNNVVEISDTNLKLKGKDIFKHLSNSKECVLMAATIGSNIEKKISMYQKIDLTKAIILDACATTAIEEICDNTENIIRKEVNNINKNITYRYSPGYGDLSLDIQKDFLQVLDTTRKIGLYCSENNLLFPRKSVTAIIGIIEKNIKINKRSCENCNNYKNCNYRKEGKNCGA